MQNNGYSEQAQEDGAGVMSGKTPFEVEHSSLLPCCYVHEWPDLYEIQAQGRHKYLAGKCLVEFNDVDVLESQVVPLE